MMNFFKRLFEKQPPLGQAFKDCKSPIDVCQVVSRWISEDAVLFPKGLVAAWELRRGNCEDFARLVSFGCSTIGLAKGPRWKLETDFSYDIWFFWPMNSIRPGHAVVLGRFMGLRWMADMAEFEWVESDDQVKRIIRRRLHCADVWSRKMM